MEDLIRLELYSSMYQRLCLDIADGYPSNDVAGDLNKIRSRLLHEGFSFLTKTLPSYRKALDRALGNPDYVLTMPGLKTQRGSALPKLFGWLLNRIFSEDGRVRSDADPQAIKHYRQLTDYLYKLELPYDHETKQTVLDSFVHTDTDLEKVCIPDDVKTELAQRLVARVLSGFCPRTIVPRHGPGAVATHEDVAGKSTFSRLYPALECMYPFTEYFMVGSSHIADDLPYISGLAVIPKATARVVLVPKDSRGPRLISCEPLEVQWIQQGISTKLVDHLEAHRITGGHVAFRDQTINQQLALRGSVTQKWATLDMKDASDRVSLQLVERLFAGLPILPALLAARSEQTLLPDGRVLRLRKFAPMGSALCFPIEALCFYALTVSVLRVHHGLTASQASRSVYVYGDDVIVPTKYAASVLQCLPSYGLKFNEGKCCTGGFFRESCGVDAYKGVIVTPLRVKPVWHLSSRTAQELSSYAAHGNALWAAGYWRTAEFVKELVEARYGRLPYLPDGPPGRSGSFTAAGSSLIGWHRSHVCSRTENKARKILRYNRDLQMHEVYGPTILPVFLKVKKRDGWRELLRSLTCGAGLLAPKRGLKSTNTNPQWYALARRSRIAYRWVPTHF